MFPDALEEAPLLGHKLAQTAPMQRPPGSVAEEGPDQPAGAQAGEGGQAERHHGVERDDAHDGVLQGGVRGQGRDGGARGGDGAEDGRGERVATARGA